ncbi:MAG: hypothetical protein L0H83_06470, partial [Salinisphaera sp.]|nr:hypothetical protein [Salinisphaera sp.]
LEQRYGAAAKRGDVIELKVGKYRILVSGNSYLSEQRIREVTAVAKTPSQAILLLTALYSAEGYLFVNVQYARKDKTNVIWVQVNEGYLAEVEAPPAIEPFFDQFETEAGLTKSDLEPMRILAELKSERAGYIMTSRYTVDPNNPQEFTLVVDGRENPNHDPLEFSVAFGNPGNRFLGRYFGLASAKYDTPWGDQIGIGYAHGFTDIGRSNGGEKYNQYQLSYNLISSWGLYALSGSFTEYEISGLFDQTPATPAPGTTAQLTIEDDYERAEILQVNLAGNQFLYADDDTRWVLEEQISYVDSTNELEQGALVLTPAAGGGTAGTGGGLLDVLTDLLGPLLGGLLGGGTSPGTATSVSLAGQRIQDEEYYTARLGTTLSDAWALFGKRGSISVGGGYKRGLGGDIQNTLTDRERAAEFDLFDAKFKVQYQLPASLVASLDLNGQLSLDDRLPQQQQFVGGGPGNLSAYLPGILVGDTGAYGRFQISLPRWEFLGGPYRFSLFVESGLARFEGNNLPIGREDTQHATDAGIKFEYAPFDWLELTVYAADGLSESGIPDEVVERSDSDAYFNVKATF